MKATILLTSACNLRCDYCYIQKQNVDMKEFTLVKAIDFSTQMADPYDRLDFGLFGGEPLLQWPLVQTAISLIEERSNNRQGATRISLVSNGTLLNDEIIQYLKDHHIILQISCDGSPHVQDMHRRFSNGCKSATVVEANLIKALHALPAVLVNVVYGPDSHVYLPESIKYFSNLGLKQIVLNPDYSAVWHIEDINNLSKTYKQIADLYLEYYHSDRPVFISLIDEKIAIILRGGYGPSERCSMGYGEFAFSPQGYIFPCERLVGDGTDNIHCIGHLFNPDNLTRTHCRTKNTNYQNIECQSCSLAGYCMNWCGCTNYFATGNYNRTSSFVCASERLAINTGFQVLKDIQESKQIAFLNHYAGLPMLNSSI